MSTELGDPSPPRPGAPEAGERGSRDGSADAHARARDAAQAMAAARARSADRAAQPPRPAPEELPTPSYAGLVTRAIAFAIDALVIDTVAIAVGAVTALALSLLNAPSETATLVAAIGGFVYLSWTAGYFVTFWSTTGETPGARLMRIRVLDARDADARLRPRRALVRLIGMTLAAIPLFAGFLLVLFDDRRRGLHDRLARTVVVYLADERAPVPAHREL